MLPWISRITVAHFRGAQREAQNGWGRDCLVAAHILFTLFKVNKSCADSCSLSACLWQSVRLDQADTRQPGAPPGLFPPPLSLSLTRRRSLTTTYQNSLREQNTFDWCRGFRTAFVFHVSPYIYYCACVSPDYCHFSFFLGPRVVVWVLTNRMPLIAQGRSAAKKFARPGCFACMRERCRHYYDLLSRRRQDGRTVHRHSC